MESLKDRLKILRKKLGISQKEMAKDLEVPFTLISKYECGKIKPGADMLSKIALKYKVNLNWLLIGKGEIFVEINEQDDFPGDIFKNNVLNYELFLDSDENGELDKNDELDKKCMILEELSQSPMIKEFVIKLIKARRGDKKALLEVKAMIKGLLLLL